MNFLEFQMSFPILDDRGFLEAFLLTFYHLFDFFFFDWWWMFTFTFAQGLYYMRWALRCKKRGVFWLISVVICYLGTFLEIFLILFIDLDNLSTFSTTLSPELIFLLAIHLFSTLHQQLSLLIDRLKPRVQLQAIPMIIIVLTRLQASMLRIHLMVMDMGRISVELYWWFFDGF